MPLKARGSASRSCGNKGKGMDRGLGNFGDCIIVFVVSSSMMRASAGHLEVLVWRVGSIEQ